MKSQKRVSNTHTSCLQGAGHEQFTVQEGGELVSLRPRRQTPAGLKLRSLRGSADGRAAVGGLPLTG